MMAVVLVLVALAGCGEKRPESWQGCRESVHRLIAAPSAPIGMTWAGCPFRSRAEVHAEGEAVVVICRCPGAYADAAVP